MLVPGDTLDGRYQIGGELGRGGMAIVYRAFDRQLRRQVALKVLHPGLARDAEAGARFSREATTAASLRHPNIVTVYDCSPPGADRPYIVMERIEGTSLTDLLERHGPLLPEVAALIARGALDGLAAAHSAGIVHRDLKPDNIMLDLGGVPRLMDFGIARAVENARLTMTGSLLGSPAFMSPEQIDGRTVDHRSDIFAFGSLLYFMTTGSLPFSGATPHEALKHICDARYPDPRDIDPSLPAGFVAIVERCLRARPEDRFPDAAGLRTAIDDFLAETGVERLIPSLRPLVEDPAGFRTIARELVLAGLVTACGQAYESGSHSRALEACSRAAALGHADPRLHAIERAILDRRRRRRLIWWAGGAVIAAVLVLALFRLAAPPAVAPEQPVAMVDAPADPPIPPMNRTQPAHLSGAIDGPGAPPRSPAVDPAPSEPAPSVRPAIRPAAPRGRPDSKVETAVADSGPVAPSPPAVDFTGSLRPVTSPWADIVVDGHRIGRYPLQREFTLPAGRHTVRFENPGCLPFETEIDLTHPGQVVEIRQRLAIRPASLRVANAQNAQLFLDGRPSGITPLQHDLPVEFPDGRPGRTLRLEARKKGFLTHAEEIIIAPGEERVVEFMLQPEP